MAPLWDSASASWKESPAFSFFNGGVSLKWNDCCLATKEMVWALVMASADPTVPSRTSVAVAAAAGRIAYLFFMAIPILVGTVPTSRSPVDPLPRARVVTTRV